jgi:hypothetical protein
VKCRRPAITRWRPARYGTAPRPNFSYAPELILRVCLQRNEMLFAHDVRQVVEMLFVLRVRHTALAELECVQTFSSGAICVVVHAAGIGVIPITPKSNRCQ